MAIATQAFSPKQFSFLIAKQNDFGVLNEDSGATPDNPYIALDVDSIGSPSLNVNQGLEHRSGSRILQATDFFQDVKGSIKEFSVSGTATTEGLDILLSNITGDADVPYSVASNAGTSTLTTASIDQADNQLLSIVYKSAYGTDADLAFKDCFCTALSFNGDANTEGGRIKFSATFKSGSVVADLTNASISIDTAITASNYYMSAWDADDRIIAGVADVILSSFSLNITNDVEFVGLTTNGFESATRAGEISATADFTCVYDANTAGLMETFNNQTTGASQGSTLMGADATPSDGSFEFKFASSVLTDVSFSDAGLMMLNASVKAVGAGIDQATALFEVSC
jgi:hypothetical protein